MNHNVCACVTLSCRKSAILPACRCLRHVIKNCHLQIVLISCSKRWSMSFLTSQTFWCTWKTLCPQCVWTCLQTINFFGENQRTTGTRAGLNLTRTSFFTFSPPHSILSLRPCRTFAVFSCLSIVLSLSHSHTHSAWFVLKIHVDQLWLSFSFFLAHVCLALFLFSVSCLIDTS